MAISIFHSKLMNIASNHSLVLIILLQFLLPSFIYGIRTMNTPHKKVPAVYFFGDSILDTGNNNGLMTVVKANAPPYGMDFKDHKATGRFSNGKLPTDFFASRLGVKELVPAYLDSNLTKEDLLTGVCFASSGCGYDTDTAFFMGAYTMPFQIDLFKDFKEKLVTMIGKKKTNCHLEKSVYIVSGGNNDVVQYFINPFKRHTRNMDTYAKFLTEKLSTFVQDLVHHGAKKVFVYGFPPVGCLPVIKTLAGGLQRDCAPEYNELAKIANSHVQVEFEKLNEKYKHKALIVYMDFYSTLLTMIDHAMDFGFQVSDSGCCGTGNLEVAILCNPLSPVCSNTSSYLFFDSYHPSERGNKILVDLLLEKYGKYIYL